jgi:hypothetical protein
MLVMRGTTFSRKGPRKRKKTVKAKRAQSVEKALVLNDPSDA